MGWVLQEDRGLLLAQGRYPARLAAVDAPNINAFGLVTGLKTYTPSRQVERTIRRNGLRALRSAGRDGKAPAARHRRLRRRPQRAAAGGEEQGQAVHARRPVRPQRARRPDLRRGRRRRGPARSVPRRAAGAPRQRRGADAVRRPLRALDADTPTTLTRTTPYARVPKKPRGNAILDAGSLRRTTTAGASAARREHADLGQQLPDRRPQALDHRPPAVRRRAPDRLLLPRPHARGRPALARPPGARRLLAREPRDDPDRPRRGLRVEPHLRRLGPHRRVRGDPLRRLVHPLPLPREVPRDGHGQRGHDQGRGPGALPHDGPRSRDRLRDGRRQARRDRPQARELRPRRALAAARSATPRSAGSPARARSSTRSRARRSRSMSATPTTATSRCSRPASSRAATRASTRGSRRSAPAATSGAARCPRRKLPQQVNPAGGALLNWNNSPAPGFGAADDNWSYGSLHRVSLLRNQIARRPSTTSRR